MGSLPVVQAQAQAQGLTAPTPSVAPAASATPSWEFNPSGFVTVAAGSVLRSSGPATDIAGWRCPCFIADYAQGGVYERGGVRLAPESKLGVQGVLSTHEGRLSLTGQAVARGSRPGELSLEWLYLTTELNSRWTLQLGRKRLPLFLSSEVQDVGYALPWISLPPQLYGWEIVNYNGANLMYRDQWQGWSATANFFGGQERVRDAGYWQIYRGKGTRTDVQWNDILGAELKLGRGSTDVRLVHIRSDQSNQAVTPVASSSRTTHQKIWGLSVQTDQGRWFGRTELLAIDRTQDYGWDYSQLMAVGYRWRDWQPQLSYARYYQRLNPGVGATEAHDSLALTLRREISKSSAVKLQWNYWKDRTEPGYWSIHGNASVLSLSYDAVF